MLATPLSSLYSVVCLVVSIGLSLAVSTTARATEEVIIFDIPAQPLPSALIAYGAATGQELYYNATLAEGRRSATVTGRLTPSSALQALLRGTGLIPRITGPGSFTIEPPPQAAPQPPSGMAAASLAPGRYEPYFAQLQSRISAVLCRGLDPGTAQAAVLLRFWLAPSGAITRAELLGAAANQPASRRFAEAMRGVVIGAPPDGMPEPVTLAIFPAISAATGCAGQTPGDASAGNASSSGAP